jgi:hypothetical protein
MTRQAATPAILAATTLLCALLLVLPGRTVTMAFVNDLVIFLDGAHRIAFGQVPNLDFHTALGPLAFYLPAMAYLLSGDFGTAMPDGMALVMLALLPPMCRILPSRLGMMPALLLGLFLILLLAAPINIGSRATELSFAMFYNRIGWVALGLLLVMHLEPFEDSRSGRIMDATAAAFLVLAQIHLKISYGLVAVVFLLFLATSRAQRRWALHAIAIVVIATPVIELVWGGTLAYLQDLASAAGVSGSHEPFSYVRSVLRNFADIVLFGIFVLLSFRWRRSLRDLAFYGFCLGAGLLVLQQNAHGWGIITLHCGAAVAAETVRRGLARSGAMGPLIGGAGAGMPLFLLFYLLPPAVNNAAALVLHATLAVVEAGTPIGLPLLKDIRFVETQKQGESFTGLYVKSMAKGEAALRSLGTPPERIMVLDFANPFSAGLGVRPPRGDSAWLHWGRNVSEKSFIPADDLFADVDILMIPRVAINSRPLQALYRDAIESRFEPAREADEWTILRKRPVSGETSGP